MFCRRHLNRARVERNPRKIEDVIRVLGQVRDAWAGISPG
jgi:flagellin-specific chaperone FliS